MLHNPDIADPFKLAKKLWPRRQFANYQRDITYSVRDNDETYVVAANQVGDWPPSSR